MKKKIRKIKFDLNGLKSGRKEDFEVLYFEMYDTLYFLALSYVKNKEIAEDLVQDSFMNLWKNKGNLKEDTNTLNYLYTLTKNNCLNYLKHLEVKDKYIYNKSLAELQFLQHSIHNLPGSFTELMGLKQDLEKAIEKLPDDLKEIFKLNRFYDLTYVKIAEKKAISIKTVEAKMSKTLKILKDSLKEYYPLIMFFYYLNKF